MLLIQRRIKVLQISVVVGGNGWFNLQKLVREVQSVFLPFLEDYIAELKLIVYRKNELWRGGLGQISFRYFYILLRMQTSKKYELTV